jgi:hypothetical protein
MSSNHTPARVRPRPGNPIDYLTRRLASTVVLVGAFLAIGGISLLESAGLPMPVAAGTGLVVFLSSAVLASQLASRRQPRGASAVTDATTRERAAVVAAFLGDLLARSTQLGPDAEQVLDRKTGART